MATFVVKCFLEMPDLSIQTRRFTLDRSIVENNGIFQLIYNKIGEVFPELKDKKFGLYWKDLDEDFVTMSTDNEMRDAISNEDNGMCKIYVKVDEEGKISDPSLEEDELPAAGGQSSSSKGDHQRADITQDSPSWQPYQTAPGLLDCPLSPRRMGPMCGPWGFRGMRGPFHGFPGHHRGMGHHGHRSHHHHGGKHHGHCGHGGHRGHGGHGFMHGWKNALRAMVPMPHRRWAKSFIQNWRMENLKNATSTSDSDFTPDVKVSMTCAGVPQAYADWLEMKLVCWHKKWSADEMSVDRKFNKKNKKAFKDSVPKEFRKWIKWYLNSHFGKREAPKFKKCWSGFQEPWETMKRSKNLGAQVPKEYRQWTKTFIRDWRIEKKLEVPSTAVSPPGDGEEASMDVGDVLSIPDAYKQWLEIFLPRWHTWHGQLDRTPGQPMRGGMGIFKDLVPMDFRAWVKHHLYKHYGKPKDVKSAAATTDPVEEKYQKMLQAFQRKWLQDLGSSSSGEDYNPKTQGKPEAQKPSEEGQQAPNTPTDPDLDQDEIVMASDFQQWVKQALQKWDGETFQELAGAQGEWDSDEDYLPPKMYRWMSKMMMKAQMKRMKRIMKHETKAVGK